MDPSAPGAAPMTVLCEDMQSLDTFEMKHKECVQVHECFNCNAYVPFLLYVVMRF